MRVSKKTDYALRALSQQTSRRASVEIDTQHKDGGALETGDVIFEINGTPAVNIKELRLQLDRLKSGDAVALQVQRHDKLIYVTLELE